MLKKGHKYPPGVDSEDLGKAYAEDGRGVTICIFNHP